MICKHCGGEVGESKKFCPYCGSEVEDKEKIYIDRPVYVYEAQPARETPETLAQKNSAGKNGTMSLIFSVFSHLFGFLFFRTIFAILSLCIAYSTQSRCEKLGIKPPKYLLVSKCLSIVSLCIAVIILVFIFIFAATDGYSS